MLNGVQNCSMAEIRANWLRMLGTLGCLLPETLIKLIIAFILKTCASVGLTFSFFHVQTIKFLHNAGGRCLDNFRSC